MANQLEELVGRWCQAGPVTSPKPGTFAVELFAGQSFPVSVRSVSDDEASLEATWMAPAEIASDSVSLANFAAGASIVATGLLRCEPCAGGVKIRMPLFLDGISRHEFLNAVAQVGRAQWVMETSVRELDARRRSIDAAQRLLDESDVALDSAETARLEAEGKASVAGPAVNVGAPAWSPTHVVPNGGMQAWKVPDGTTAPLARIDGGVQVVVRERQGGWANVIASNGWSAWVDGALLVPRP